MNIYASTLLIFIGILIGALLSIIAILNLLYDERYYNGFGAGYEEGRRYGEKKAHENDFKN